MPPISPEDSNKMKEILGFPGLNRRKKARVVFKLWIKPSFSPWICWGLLKEEGSYFVRRIILVANQEKYKIENDIFGSEVEIKAENAEKLISELRQIHIKPFEFENRLGLDGVSYGVSFEEFSVQAELNWWQAAPESWRGVEMWHEMVVKEFQSILPKSNLLENR